MKGEMAATKAAWQLGNYGNSFVVNSQIEESIRLSENYKAFAL
jgi:hypothetical protein